MLEDLINIVNNTSIEKADEFLEKTKSTLAIKKYIEKVTVDFSWVDAINETLPYLDKIIRNPRRFITTEEDIIIIEKTKKVTEESIKHLAQNTGLIQDIDDKGFVKPKKLLNVFKEETIDLYENRFIFTLVNHLYVFIQTQLLYEDEESFNKEIKTLNYEGQTKFQEEDVSIQLSLRSANYQDLTQTSEKVADLKARIGEIRDVIDSYKKSDFMKTMANATPVRSPIRKTNIILKDTNFQYALRLWEYLEKFQIETPLKKYKETINLKNAELDKNYSLTYFLNYCLLDESDNDLEKKTKHAALKKLIFDTAKDFDNDEKEIRKILNEELKAATKYKEEQIKGINSTYNDFITKHYNRMSEALFILK